MRSVTLAAVALLVACGADPNLDTDLDGITDAMEAELGTDPERADTDGDGFTDLEESDAGTDPLSATDHPYQAGWPMDTHCRDTIQPTGNDEGQIAEDFALFNQHGNAEKVRLYDFCDRTVLLVSSGFG